MGGFLCLFGVSDFRFWHGYQVWINSLTEKEALQLWIDGEPTPPTLARQFIRWLYENGYEIQKTKYIYNSLIKSPMIEAYLLGLCDD